MKCPVCSDTQLVMADRQGVEIDYCPDCRGVWLDRGELDKIIERAAPAPPSGGGDARARSGHETHGGHSSYGGKPHKRKSMLGELFDF